MGARYYDPTLGRFLGMDPAAFNEEDLYTLNRYAYANNNPYKYVDPDGRWAIALIALIAMAVVAAAALIAVSSNTERSRNLAMQFQVFFEEMVSGGGSETEQEPGATQPAAAGSQSTPADPNQQEPEEPKRSTYTRIHSDKSLRESSSYRYWSTRSNDEIIQSLRPNGSNSEALTVSPDGRIFQGNTRMLILEERGVETSSLPYNTYVPGAL
jgi:hypothetical protein